MFNLVSKKKNRRAEQSWEGLPAGGNARCSSVQPASLQPPVSSLGHVLTCTSPVLSLRISLMGNPVHSALLPASGVASEGGRSGIRSINQRGSRGHRDCLNVVL